MFPRFYLQSVALHTTHATDTRFILNWKKHFLHGNSSKISSSQYFLFISSLDIYIVKLALVNLILFVESYTDGTNRYEL